MILSSSQAERPYNHTLDTIHLARRPDRKPIASLSGLTLPTGIWCRQSSLDNPDSACTWFGSIHDMHTIAEKGQWCIESGKEREIVVPRRRLLTSHGRVMSV